MRTPAICFFVLCLVSAFSLGRSFHIRKHANHEPGYAAVGVTADDAGAGHHDHAGHGHGQSRISGITTYSGPNRVRDSTPGGVLQAQAPRNGVDVAMKSRSGEVDEDPSDSGLKHFRNAIHAWIFGSTSQENLQDSSNPHYSKLSSSPEESTLTPLQSHESPEFGPYRIGSSQKSRSRPFFRKRRHP